MKHIIENFIDNVKKKPKNIALVTTNGEEYTYEDIDIIVKNLASYFHEIGIKKGDIIPIIMKRDEFIIFTTLALFSIGAAYVPIAETYPKERIKYILEMFPTNILLANYNFKNDFLKNDINIVNVTKKIYKSGKINFEYDIDNLAYIIFTSGSTGKPKGVEITHKNLAWIINTLQEKYPQTENDAYLFNTPYTFDVSVTEMYGWIVAETKLIIPCMKDEELVKSISSIIKNMNVSHLAMSPSFMKMLVNINENNGVEFYKKLKYVFLAGEIFPVDLAIQLRKIAKDVQLYNLYGPTETTVYATYHKITDDVQKIIPIGKVFNGVTIKVMNDNNEVENGKQGELYIGGAGLCRGYYKNKELTNEKFTTINGIKYYKTGDYVYINENGDLIYVERIDQQVQINGIRVELGEIENVVKEKMNFKDCKVLYHEQRLLCFYLNNKTIDSNDIYKTIEKSLPKYMVPKIYIRMESYPINTNRKIDRNGLVARYNEYMEKQSSKSNVSNSNEERKLKEEICKIIKKFCKIDNIASDLNLITIGIDSLEMISIIMTLEDKLGIRLPDDLFYMMPTVDEVSSYISTNYNIFMKNNDWGTINITNEILLAEVVEEDIFNDLKGWSEEILNRKNCKKYNTLYLQKIYHYDNFESFLYADIELQQNGYSLKKVSQALNKLINQNELLRSILHEDDGLFFIEKEPRESGRILKEYLGKDESYINSCALKYLKENKLDEILFYPYIVKYEQRIILKLIISHNIMDQKSIANLKKDFYNLLNGAKIQKRENYESYIKLLENKNNNGNFVENNHISKLLRIKAHSFKNYNNDKIFMLNFDLGNKYKTEEQKIIQILDKILKTVLLASGQISCIASTILNYREIDGKNFNDCVGDYHTAIVFPYFLESSNEKNIVSEVIELYKDGYQPQQYVFKDYPQMSQEQKKLEYALDLNVFASINYLGEIRKENLERVEEELYNSRKEFSKFPGKKMYITCFTVRKKCYAYFLTAPKEIKNYCNN